jgi:hypothetical protein
MPATDIAKHHCWIELPMEKKIIFWVVSLSLVAVALAILLPGGRHADSNPKLPWQVHLTPEGKVEVFDLVLGQSTLANARDAFQSEGKVNLFIDDTGNPTLEAYFERVFLSGLRADFVLVLDADKALLTRIYNHGSRISRSTNLTHKVELSSGDLQLVGDLAVKLINYIPYANLNEKLVSSRFGQPGKKITETETGITHWIYPDKGVSIGINPKGKELIQYMPLDEVNPLISRMEENNRRYESTQHERG